jgi:prolyl-tRNA synthetase
MAFEGLEDNIAELLDTMQEAIYTKALNYRDEHITEVTSWEEFQKVLETKGGFISAHWDGTAETEDAIQQATKATIRCIPFDNPQEDGVCVFSGKPSKERVLFAKAY